MAPGKPGLSPRTPQPWHPGAAGGPRSACPGGGCCRGRRGRGGLVSDSFVAAPSHPPPSWDSPAVGRALITQIHRHGHEGAGHLGVGDDPQIGCLVPAEPGEAVVRALTAIGGQLQGRKGGWGAGEAPQLSLPKPATAVPAWDLALWQDLSTGLQHRLPPAGLEAASRV